MLRVVDPEFETPVATDYMYSVGIVFILALPIILSANLPAYSVTQGNKGLFWLAVGIFALYLVGVFIAYVVLAKEKAFAKRRQLFHREEE